MSFNETPVGSSPKQLIKNKHTMRKQTYVHYQLGDLESDKGGARPSGTYIRVNLMNDHHPLKLAYGSFAGEG